MALVALESWQVRGSFRDSSIDTFEKLDQWFQYTILASYVRAALITLL